MRNRSTRSPNSTANTIANNGGAGVLADGNAILQLSNSTIEYNGTGASVANGGRLFTYQNNVIDNNVGEDLSPAATASVQPVSPVPLFSVTSVKCLPPSL